MPLTATAQTNRARLFGARASALAPTDPELVEVFGNWAFDEVVSRSRLPEGLRLQTTLAALIALGAVAEYRVMLAAALNVGVTPVEAKEVVYTPRPTAGRAESSTSCAPPTTSWSSGGSNYRSRVSRRPPPPPGGTRDSPSRQRSSATGSRPATTARPPTNATFTNFSAPTASATTGHGAGWTCPPANSSRSPC